MAKFHAVQKVKSGKSEQFVVKAKSTGKVLGRHPTREKAIKQLRAVEWSIHGGHD